MKMNDNGAADQRWDQLQARIDQMFSKYLRPELPENVCKTRNMEHVLQMPPDHEKNYTDRK